MATNAPPHRGMFAIGPNGKTPNVARGYIVTDDGGGTSAVKGKHRLNFLYNPSAISTGYAIDISTDEINIGNAYDPRDGGSYRVMPNQRLSFAIMFDRTHEVNEGSIPNGVQHDIEVLKALVGLKEKVEGTSGTESRPDWTGLMLYSPVWFVFSSNSGALRIFGVIENIDISWELFSSQQVPLRCSVQISARMIPPTKPWHAERQVDSDTGADRVWSPDTGIPGHGGRGGTAGGRPIFPESRGGILNNQPYLLTMRND